MAAKESNAFGALLRQHRTRAGLTQEELAERTDLSVRGLVYLEHGTHRPYPHTLQRLATALGLTPAQHDALADASCPTGVLAAPPLAISARLAAPPVPPTPLIGRERAVAAVVALLREPGVRLVSLTGPGGTGKTRLALAVTAALTEDFANAVAFVPLAALTDPELVLPAIAAALGVKIGAGRSPTEAARAALRDRHLLLVLDNIEQVISAAPEIANLLTACPGLAVLVTSRAALRLRGEHEFPVPPLELPAPDHLPPPDALGEYEAIRLFVERAREIRADFALTVDNAGTVTTICQRLDGLPLAIELAAARMRALAPPALLARLARRLDLLTNGAHDLPQRQRTLRATIDWSHGLLAPDERTLFRRLAVFVGGCTLEAAEAICATDPPFDVLDGIEALIGQSLGRQVDGADGEPRYRMLETIREYATGRLAASGEVEGVHEAHAAYYLVLAERAASHLTSAARSTWVATLACEQDNFRAALNWVVGRGQAERALRLTGALTWFWYLHGDLTEGRRWLAAALALPPPGVPARARATALAGAGSLAHLQGDEAAAGPLLEESVALWRALGDRRDLAYALTSLGQVAWFRGDAAAARALGEESVALLRATEDRWGLALALQDLGQAVLAANDLTGAQAHYEEILAIYGALGDRWGRGLPLLGLGRVALARGDYPAARTALEESRRIFAASGDQRLLAHALHRLAQLARREGDWARAEACYWESLSLWRALGQRLGLGLGLTGLAGVAAGRGEMERAARLGGAAEGMLVTVGAVLSPTDRNDEAPYRAAAQAALGADRFAALWAEGQALLPEDALAAALDHG